MRPIDADAAIEVYANAVSPAGFRVQEEFLDEVSQLVDFMPTLDVVPTNDVLPLLKDAAKELFKVCGCNACAGYPSVGKSACALYQKSDKDNVEPSAANCRLKMFIECLENRTIPWEENQQ